MEGATPSLTEPGVKYFLRETLRQCRGVKDRYYSLVYNGLLLALFVSLLAALLVYKRRTKPTAEDVKARREMQREYILGKIKAMGDAKKKEENTLITSLPSFEAPFLGAM